MPHFPKPLVLGVLCLALSFPLDGASVLQDPDKEKAKKENTRGIELFNKKDYIGAAAAFRKAVELNPDSAVYHFNLGNTLTSQKKYSEAEPSLRRALSIRTDSTTYMGLLAYVLRYLGKFPEAEELYGRAIAISPNDHTLHKGLGITLYWGSRFDEAIEAYRKAISLNPNSGPYHSYLANALYLAGERTDARRAVRRAVSLGYKDFWVKRVLDIEAGAGRRPDQAVSYDQILKSLVDGIDSAEIIRQLETSPTLFTLSNNQLRELKAAGASDRLIALMQGRSGGDGNLPELTDLVIILDCSLSMREEMKSGETKLSAAKRVVSALIKDLPDGLHTVLVVYGYNARLRCEAARVEFETSDLSPRLKALAAQRLSGVTASGMTPIALSLRMASRELAQVTKEGKAGVILITDGKETCKGDPAAEAAFLAMRPNLTFGLRVVGFDLSDEERAAAERIARAGKGTYLNAEDADALTRALNRVKKEIVEKVVESTFADGPDGWAAVKDGPGSPEFPVEHVPDPGYLQARDPSDGVWYWKAPPKFLGDLSSAYGKSLTFDLAQDPTKSQFDAIDVIFDCGDVSLAFNTQTNPGKGWTSYRVPLDESAGWTIRKTRRPLTVQEFTTALKSVKGLYIRGEFHLKTEFSPERDLGRIDNVRLGGEPKRIEKVAVRIREQDRDKLLRMYGGSDATEEAVRNGLKYLARHQAADGSWSSKCVGGGAESRCEREQVCRTPGSLYPYAQTGLALLAFQGHGNSVFNGQEYSDRVKAGIEWLVDHQSEGGGLRDENSGKHFMYEHGIALFALAEAVALYRSAGVAAPGRYVSALQRGITYAEDCQHNDGGWKYTLSKTEGSDTSVTGWVLLALTTAKDAGMPVDPDGLKKLGAYMKAARWKDTPQTGYGIRQAPLTEATTGVGLLAHYFLLETPRSAHARAAAAYLASVAERETSSPDYYELYNCTTAMFQAGGPEWETWNALASKKIVEEQLKKGCERGSWHDHGRYTGGGRICSTAMAVITLEVYYRYPRLNQ